MVSVFLIKNIHVRLVEQGLTDDVLWARLVPSLSLQIKFYWCTGMPIHSLTVLSGRDERPYDPPNLKESLSDPSQETSAKSCYKTSEKKLQKSNTKKIGIH